MLQIDKKLVEVDVLIAGGGIAGLMAGIRAAGEGVSVAVVEKANTKRSGSGATGNDHFCCYIPEVHGDDLGPILWEDLHSLHGDFQDPSLAKLFLEQTYDRVKDWDRWGISMRPKGRWRFFGSRLSRATQNLLKYAGYNQKAVLTEQAKKQGVRILNHHVVTDVIVSGDEVVGALAISTQGEDPVLKVFRAKAVILATGAATRLYPSDHAGLDVQHPRCVSPEAAGPLLTGPVRGSSTWKSPTGTRARFSPAVERRPGSVCTKIPTAAPLGPSSPGPPGSWGISRPMSGTRSSRTCSSREKALSILTARKPQKRTSST